MKKYFLLTSLKQGSLRSKPFKLSLILILFPNPFSDNLTITLNQNEPVEINVYDVVGTKLLQQTFTTSTTLNTSQLAKGIYIYEVMNSGGVFKKGKVVKE